MLKRGQNKAAIAGHEVEVGRTSEGWIAWIDGKPLADGHKARVWKIKRDALSAVRRKLYPVPT